MMLRIVPSESATEWKSRREVNVVLFVCCRVYCAPCIEKLCGSSELEKVSDISLLSCLSY